MPKMGQHFEIPVPVNKNRSFDLEIPVPVNKNRNQALNIRFRFRSGHRLVGGIRLTQFNCNCHLELSLAEMDNIEGKINFSV